MDRRQFKGAHEGVSNLCSHQSGKTYQAHTRSTYLRYLGMYLQKWFACCRLFLTSVTWFDAQFTPKIPSNKSKWHYLNFTLSVEYLKKLGYTMRVFHFHNSTLWCTMLRSFRSLAHQMGFAHQSLSQNTSRPSRKDPIAATPSAKCY